MRTSAHNMSFLYADSESHQLIEILPDRLSKNIKEYFLGYSLQNRRQVEYVIMKSQWRLFMKSYNKLNKNTRVYLAGVKELMTEEESLDLFFDHSQRFTLLGSHTRPF
ncbi:transposase [Weissella cibaria]|uniref:transposase n=1 Tax=Weissella cibaria TaxID=137591 RepID=UPI0021BD99E6|nr:transposase [Weissella cibaria]